ncbi:putative two-component system response regulator [Candidatus Burkholderia verschuerenii]|uniref:Putative two-component system response regulator n=1 Tax=Candidatus Burkholderia verschuerenii TaxID=242163 RepID=A0A0L0MAW7_9BURK|nr:response regulator [Candidatus Burkholderia verschuerenii]KND59867.1 putative two-component system response regulator [Candidatus Burkholderia verschuerenii]
MNAKRKTIGRFEQWSDEVRPAIDKRRVLVVDDYQDIADALSAILEVKGFDTRVALAGKSALWLFQTWRPHAVILDISLPDVSGVEIGRRMRSAARHDAALLAHTALDASEIRRDAIAAGFGAFLGKPVSPPELAAVIDALCPGAREWAKARRRARDAAFAARPQP